MRISSRQRRCARVTVSTPARRSGRSRERLPCRRAEAPRRCRCGAAFPSSAHAVSQSPPTPVVGAGTINVPMLAVRSAPRADDSRVIARLSEFRPQDYRPRYVLAIAVKNDRKGKPAWYKISVPGRPNGRTGWVHGAAGRRFAQCRGRSSSTAAHASLAALEGQAARLLRARSPSAPPGWRRRLGLYYVTVRFKPCPGAVPRCRSPSRRAPTRSSPTGPAVESSGLHGWNDPSVLGQAVSHGCIRVSNETADLPPRPHPARDADPRPRELGRAGSRGCVASNGVRRRRFGVRTALR